GEITDRRKDGGLRITQSSITPVKNERGKIVNFVEIKLDVTEKKQAENALKQRARELQTLYETSLEINSQTSLNTLLSSIVERAASLLDTNSGGIYLMESDEQTLKLVVGYNLPQKFVGITLTRGEGLSGQVAQSGTPFWVEDYQTWSKRSGVYDGISFRRVLGVPLKVKGRVIGVINVSDLTHAGAFSEDEVRLANLFADQAALAVESARLHEQERNRNRELATLYKSAMIISSNLSLEVVLQSVVEQATRAINADGCSISFINAPQDAVVTMVDYRAIPIGEIEASGATYFLNDYPATRRVLETREPLSLSRGDPKIDPAELALMNQQEKDAVLLLPLVARNQVVGLMEIYGLENKERVFTNSEVRLAQSLSVQTAIFIDNARLFEHAERRLRRTQALRKIDQAIAGSIDMQMVLKIVLEQVIAELEVDAAVILLYNPHELSLKFKLGSGLRTNALKFTNLRLGEGYAGRVALGRQTIFIPNLQARTTDFLRSPTFSQEGFVCYFGVPLIAKGEVKGVIEIFHRSPKNPDNEWLEFMEALAGQIAIAIDNATLYADLQLSNIELSMAYDSTIEGWSRALDLRDKETEGHTLRVTELMLDLAREAGMTEAELVHVRRGALLHDIGKMGVPDQILLKPGKLTDEEWVIMRQHPIFAHEMLSPIEYLRPALDIPYCHHEKWDGTGYPRGLKGEQIPLVARLFAVVDIWDALRADRPYRQSWSEEKTLEYIRSLVGTHLDPRAVEIFLRVITNANNG
ncbi:MAG: GAF domain-containing protein, partial [Anaerolineales bacterium]|nr:GAF domain-containing protein [Anaerolineales bacterium]